MRVVKDRGLWKTVGDDGSYLESFATEQEANVAAGLEDFADAEEEIETEDSEEETYTDEQEIVCDGESDGEEEV
jgi:hypothetical protein